MRITLIIDQGADWAVVLCDDDVKLEGHIADVAQLDELLPRLKREGVDLTKITLDQIDVEYGEVS